MKISLTMALSLSLFLALHVGKAHAQDYGDPEFIVHVPVDIPALHEDVTYFRIRCVARDLSNTTVAVGTNGILTPSAIPYNATISVELQVPSIGFPMASVSDVTVIFCNIRVRSSNYNFRTVYGSESAVADWFRAAPNTPFAGSVQYSLP